MRLGVAAALVDGVEVAGDVELAEGRVAAVGVSPPGAAGLAVPGFVDVQVNGFGGGGMHGYRALEGTFLGGCLFSGRVAGRAAARAVDAYLAGGRSELPAPITAGTVSLRL